MKLVFKGRSGDRVRTLVWISEEEFNKDCDAMEAPWSHYKVEPDPSGGGNFSGYRDLQVSGSLRLLSC